MLWKAVLELIRCYIDVVGSHGSRTQFVSGLFGNGGLERGEHLLYVVSSASLRCIVCSLCSTICPANALSVTLGSTSGLRVLVGYTVCYNRCILCGICDVICPTGACTQCSYLNASALALMLLSSLARLVVLCVTTVVMLLVADVVALARCLLGVLVL